MIEIKEEDIILDWKGMDEIHIFYSEEQLGKKLKQQILQNQKLRELVEDKIKTIENNLTGADQRLHPEIYKVAMDVCSNLKQFLKESQDG